MFCSCIELTPPWFARERERDLQELAARGPSLLGFYQDPINHQEVVIMIHEVGPLVTNNLWFIRYLSHMYLPLLLTISNLEIPFILYIYFSHMLVFKMMRNRGLNLLFLLFFFHPFYNQKTVFFSFFYCKILTGSVADKKLRRSRQRGRETKGGGERGSAAGVCRQSAREAEERSVGGDGTTEQQGGAE